MQLIDQLRALEEVEASALVMPAPNFGETMPMIGLPSGMAGAMLIEDEIAALLKGASDQELADALARAREDADRWSEGHLAAELHRRGAGVD